MDGLPLNTLMVPLLPHPVHRSRCLYIFFLFETLGPLEP